MDSGVKKFRDKRLDLVDSHNVDIFARQKNLVPVKSDTAIDRIETTSKGRFSPHALEGHRGVVDKSPGLIKDKVTLLSGSKRDEVIEKNNQAAEGKDTRFEKQIERIKEAFRRKT
ncbi:MAG: hypothetical protein V1703_03010 [Candidatus Altiarchaeota archaeon]